MGNMLSFIWITMSGSQLNFMHSNGLVTELGERK